MFRFIITFGLALLVSCAGAVEKEIAREPESAWCAWREHPENPLLAPGIGQPILGDPTFLPPSQTPDGLWHLIANALDGLYHFTSDDGVHWTRRQTALFGALHMRSYLVVENARYYLLYERYMSPLDSRIEMRTSADLFEWSEPRTLLTPTLPWEQSAQRITGNPFLIRMDGKYRLYYSADSVYLHDSLYFEPKYISVAYADSITGPYVKLGEPLFGPDPADPYRNAGAGSMKILQEPINGRWYALNNGIYLDPQGRSRSAIMLLSSVDGDHWEAACREPILKPGEGWKQAYVYAFDLRRVGDELWLYFNARDGWFEGKERIGLATLPIPAE